MGMTPQVMFAKHTDPTAVFGSAGALSFTVMEELNGPGTFVVEFNGADIADAFWTQTIPTVGDERATPWNRPGFFVFQTTTGRRITGMLEPVASNYGPDFLQGRVRFQGRGIASILDYATVTGATGDAILKTHQGETRASIFLDFVTAAQARTWATWVAPSFNGSTDTASNSWTDADTVIVRAGGTLLGIFTDYGAATWDWLMRDDGTLDAWVLAGEDLSGVVEIHPVVHGVGSDPDEETIDFRSLYTTSYAEIPNGPGQSASQSVMVSRYGQRESYQSLGGTDETSVISVLGQISDEQSVLSRSRKIRIDPTIEGARPGQDFSLGDTITVVGRSMLDYDGTDVFKSTARVMGWSWTLGEDGSETCDLILDSIIKHRRRRWTDSSDSAQGNIPVPNLDGTGGTTFDGITDGSGNVNPYTQWGTKDPGYYQSVAPATTPSTDNELKPGWGLIKDAADAHGTGDFPVTVIRSVINDDGDQVYFELDPNPGSFGIRSFPSLGFLPGWTQVSADFIGDDPTINAFNTPQSADASVDDGARVFFSDNGATGQVRMGAEAELSGVGRNYSQVSADLTSAGVSANYDDGAVQKHVAVAADANAAIVSVQTTEYSQQGTLAAHETDGVYLQVGQAMRVVHDPSDNLLLALNGGTGAGQVTITGDRSDGTALANLLTFLALRGDIIDSTSA